MCVCQHRSSNLLTASLNFYVFYRDKLQDVIQPMLQQIRHETQERRNKLVQSCCSFLTIIHSISRFLCNTTSMTAQHFPGHYEGEGEKNLCFMKILLLVCPIIILPQPPSICWASVGGFILLSVLTSLRFSSILFQQDKRVLERACKRK